MIRIETTTINGEIAYLTLRGRLVLGDETRDFRNAIDGIIGQKKYLDIVIEMSGITKIDCAGLGELVRAHEEGLQRGKKVCLISLPKRVKDLLVLTKLIAVFGAEDLIEAGQ